MPPQTCGGGAEESSRRVQVKNQVLGQRHRWELLSGGPRQGSSSPFSPLHDSDFTGLNPSQHAGTTPCPAVSEFASHLPPTTNP